MKKILFALSVFSSILAFAQDVPVDKEEVLVEIGEEKTIFEDSAEVTVIHTNDQGEPLSYLVKNKDNKFMILGVSEKFDDHTRGIVNAYAGFQTMFGVNAGISLFKIIDIGVHARSNSLGNEGLLYPSVTKTGFHANIKFRPVKEVEVYSGVRWNQYSSTRRGYGYSNLQYNGNTTEYVGGIRYHIDNRQSIGFEAGFTKGSLTKTESPGGYIPSTTGQNFSSPTKNFKAPVFNLTYRITLFNH